MKRFFLNNLRPDISKDIEKRDELSKSAKSGNTKMENALKRAKVSIKTGRN